MTNLHVEASFRDIKKHFVVGTKSLTIDVNITKSGDAAYGCELYLVFPEYMAFSYIGRKNEDEEVNFELLTIEEMSLTEKFYDSQTEKLISDIREQMEPLKSVLLYSLGDLLLNNTSVLLNIFMTVSDLENEEKIQAAVIAVTQSNETDQSDNLKVLQMPLIHQVCLSLSGYV